MMHSSVADHRLWRIDAAANYGPLDGLARNRINTSPAAVAPLARADGIAVREY